MRDLLLAGIMAWLVIRALIHPWIGIMAWTWVSIMNPHKLSWTLELLPIAAIVGGATLIGLFISKDRRQFFVTPETALLIAFTLWMCVTLPFSIFVDASMPMWNRVMKINFMILVSMMVLYSKKHIICLGRHRFAGVLWRQGGRVHHTHRRQSQGLGAGRDIHRGQQ